MAVQNGGTMATGRGITTESEREYLRGEHGDQRRYEAKSRIKKRIQEQVAEDVTVFAEETPELLDELREIVCNDE